jgi:hypothetical protein
MTSRLCPLCFEPIPHYLPFCSVCWKLYTEDLRQALDEKSEWLRWLQADAAKESDRRQKEREQGQLLYD